MRRKADLVDQQFKVWERAQNVTTGAQPVLACSTHIWCATPPGGRAAEVEGDVASRGRAS